MAAAQESTEFKNKVAFITGASRGIGTAIAYALAAKGCHLALTARSGQVLSSLKDTLCQLFPESTIWTATLDVRNAEEVMQVVQKARQQFGKIDILINNAGVAGKIGLFQESSVADIDRTIDTNLKGAMYMMRAVVPLMASQQNGTIININSVAGKTAFPFWSVYDASKFGLHAVTQAVAEEQRQNNVRVMGIYPGAVDTSIWDSIDLENNPNREGMLRPEDIANAVVYALQQPQDVFVTEITVGPLKPAL